MSFNPPSLVMVELNCTVSVPKICESCFVVRHVRSRRDEAEKPNIHRRATGIEAKKRGYRCVTVKSDVPFAVIRRNSGAAWKERMEPPIPRRLTNEAGFQTESGSL